MLGWRQRHQQMESDSDANASRNKRDALGYPDVKCVANAHNDARRIAVSHIDRHERSHAIQHTIDDRVVDVNSICYVITDANGNQHRVCNANWHYVCHANAFAHCHHHDDTFVQ